jgi:hypothetical protein
VYMGGNCRLVRRRVFCTSPIFGLPLSMRACRIMPIRLAALEGCCSRWVLESVGSCCALGFAVSRPSRGLHWNAPLSLRERVRASDVCRRLG